jgi:LemA protein
VARREYVQAVQRYNTELRTIPGRWWRKFMYAEMQAKENFSISEAETQNPQVNFNN